MRPVYENSDSLKAEEQTIRRVAEAWKTTYVKLPMQYRVDWALLRGGVVAWCECTMCARWRPSPTGGPAAAWSTAA